MESILTSIKKLIGIEEDFTHFDPDIIMHINTAFMSLTQIGLGPVDGFRIEDESTTWDEFIPEDRMNLEAVKTYLALKVRLVFDPPPSSTAIDSIKQTIAELEWRLNVTAESAQSN